MTSGHSLKVALAYMGDEQVSWARQAFKEHKHYYVMPAILYVAAQLEARAKEAGVESVRCRYFNRAVHGLDQMVEALLEEQPDLVGLSCYSWNLKDNLDLARRLKQRAPTGLKVVLGGPEVSCERTEEAEAILDANPQVDALVLGEGEDAFGRVVAAYSEAGQPAGIPNVVYRDGNRICAFERRSEPVDLSLVPQIDPTVIEVERTDGTGLAMVYQTYRGCPYKCEYCSFHGGAKGIRRFPIERIESELKRLFDARVSFINFADAAFDINRRLTKEILKMCVAHNRQTSMLCYAAFQSMDEELADLLEQSGMLVGIGLQSVYKDVLGAVGRNFSVDRFFSSIEKLGQRRINYYIDLMFGLPGDSPQRFRNSFNAVMALKPPFVLPFPLTIIPRSVIAANLEEHEVVRYDDDELAEAIQPVSGLVYADIGLHRNFDLSDLKTFDDLCTAIFYAWQRHPFSLQNLADYARLTAGREHGLDAYAVFVTVGVRIREAIGDEPVDVAKPPLVENPIREALVEVLGRMGARDVEIEALEALMKVEGAATFLVERSEHRAAYRTAQKRALQEIEASTGAPAQATAALKCAGRVLQLPFTFESLNNLSELRESIPKQECRAIVLTPYDDWQIHVIDLCDLEAALCDELSVKREVRLAAVKRRLSRHPDFDSFEQALKRLGQKGVIGIYRPAG